MCACTCCVRCRMCFAAWRACRLSRSERFKTCLWRLKACTMVHGVQRTTTLKRLGGFPNCWATDLALLPALAIEGSFFQIPSILFFRRQNRICATEDASDTLERLDPGMVRDKKTRPELYAETRWALLRMIWKSPIPLLRRLHLSAMTLVCYWSRWRVGFWGSDILLRVLPSTIRRNGLLRVPRAVAGAEYARRADPLSKQVHKFDEGQGCHYSQ